MSADPRGPRNSVEKFCATAAVENCYNIDSGSPNSSEEQLFSIIVTESRNQRKYRFLLRYQQRLKYRLFRGSIAVLYRFSLHSVSKFLVIFHIEFTVSTNFQVSFLRDSQGIMARP